jgi:hypothetical protein
MNSSTATNGPTSIDLYAAFGSDVCLNDQRHMQATPFCFTTGSGHQYFLDTARQLFEVVTSDRILAAITQRGEPTDEKLCLRWNPVEDRRYAVMESDPTASDNKPKTNWARNLLAYRGLVFFPCVPGKGANLCTAGWNNPRDGWTWPVWTVPLGASVVRSLLTHPGLARPAGPDASRRALGIAAIFRCQRISVGKPPLQKNQLWPGPTDFLTDRWSPDLAHHGGVR